MYTQKKIKVKTKKGIVERYLIIRKDENDVIPYYSVANKFLRIFSKNKRADAYSGKAYVSDIAKFLNFLEEKGHDSEKYLSEVTIDDADEYMLLYCNTLLPSGFYPGNSARIRIRCNISRFLENIRESGINENLQSHFIKRKIFGKGNCREKTEYEIQMAFEEKGQVYRVERKCPDFFVNIFLEKAKLYKPNCWVAACFQYYGGFRPSEVCNLRHESSIYGSNFTIVRNADYQLCGIVVDLSNPSNLFQLRSDGKNSNIKRLRFQSIYPPFLKPLWNAYLSYQKLTVNWVREEKGPFIVQKRRSKIAVPSGAHVGYCYRNYRDDFKIICEKYVFPELIKNGGREAMYAKKMMNSSYGPHMLRHFFTEELVNKGASWIEIQEYRGDSPSNPNTAAMYILKGGGVQSVVDDNSTILYKMMGSTEIGEMNKIEIKNIPRSL